MDCTHAGGPTRLHFCSARAACLPPETPALISSLSPTSVPTQAPPGSTWGAFSRERAGYSRLAGQSLRSRILGRHSSCTGFPWTPKPLMSGPIDLASQAA